MLENTKAISLLEYSGPIWVHFGQQQHTAEVEQQRVVVICSLVPNGIIMLIAASWTISDQSMCAYEQNQKQCCSHKHLQLAWVQSQQKLLDLCCSS